LQARIKAEAPIIEIFGEGESDGDKFGAETLGVSGIEDKGTGIGGIGDEGIGAGGDEGTNVARGDFGESDKFDVGGSL
jgi:hypothetical protein